jgi:hypothetical protein
LAVAYYSNPEDDDDEIYIYGTKEYDENAKWKVSANKVVLGISLPNVKGHFADLKLATLQDKNGKTNVVAKMNKGF